MRKTYRAMVCAPQPEATEAGLDILMAGGNAVDAAVATGLVQSVVDPLMCGIAGFGSMAVYLPERQTHLYLDFHARAPNSARADMWVSHLRGEARDGFGFILKDYVNELGYESIAVPGTLKAFHEAQREYGVLPWAAVVQPAIDWARRGWTVRPHVRDFWSMGGEMGHAPHSERLVWSKSGRALYCRDDGTPKEVNERVVNPDYADTLELIAREGADVFYIGELAQRMVEDIRRHGGRISLTDLANYRVLRHKPLRGTYRDYEVTTNHPPGGGVMLLQMLNVLENFDLRAIGHNTAEYLRVMSETMKRSSADKDRYLGDPAFFNVPYERLVDKAQAARYADAIKRGEVAHVPRVNAGTPTKDTTQVSVVDRSGNCVSMTHSLGLPSGAITDHLGFMYNGCMAQFDPRPGSAASIAPGKARFSSMCPSILFQEGKPVMVIGAPGATQIVMGVLQAILNVLEFGMNMTEAVSAPRFSSTSDVIDIANRIPHRVSQALGAMGYEVLRDARTYGFASIHGIRVTSEGLEGGADPNHDGCWMGL
ncbi:gamma-glutamyltransferase [Cupriavidus basilensis]|uniref:Glutathione hydrolase proenzyme n=2 Tax=Cupriavidus basilensis TaxID=68895 RepID=A0ABT6B0Q3_9BURK|nr:gamma-glutamyltransferase [Cupriavidus basilensis]MDF3838461.1 gamma-glutamyltransferase [Cupriavidus basilensis]